MSRGVKAEQGWYERIFPRWVMCFVGMILMESALINISRKSRDFSHNMIAFVNTLT